jgi:hypothetical protein
VTRAVFHGYDSSVLPIADLECQPAMLVLFLYSFCKFCLILRDGPLASHLECSTERSSGT